MTLMIRKRKSKRFSNQNLCKIACGLSRLLVLLKETIQQKVLSYWFKTYQTKEQKKDLPLAEGKMMLILWITVRIIKIIIIMFNNNKTLKKKYIMSDEYIN